MNRLSALIKQLFLVVVSLALSAALLLGAVLGYLYAQDGLSPQAKPFDTTRFRFLEGGGEQVRGMVRVDAFDKGRAMVGTGRNVLDVDKWPYLAVEVVGLGAQDRATFYWQIPGQGELVGRGLRMLMPGLPCVFDMRSDPSWQGHVMEQGFMLEGQDSVVEIRNPRLLAEGTTAGWAAMACEWLSFRPWSQRSGNFTAANLNTQRIWLIPLTAVWLLLAVGIWVVLWTMGRWPLRPGGLLLIPVAGWLAGDLRGLTNGLEQYRDTASTYAGLTIEERDRSGRDEALTRFIDGLKQRHLLDDPVDIFIVADPEQRYLRLRAQYHLLPHRVFNYHKTPMRQYARRGGYLLILNEPQDLQRDLINGWLLKDRKIFLKTELLEKGTLGDLYRLPARSGGSAPQQSQPTPDVQQAGQ